MRRLAQIFVIAALTATSLSACSGKQSCASAGGTCVGLTPDSCQIGQVGDANQFDCGSGIGVECCLPPDAGT